MLDTKYILANLDLVKKATKDKLAVNEYTDFDRFVQLDEQRRNAQTEKDKLLSEKKKLSKQVGPLMGQKKKADESEHAALDEKINALQNESRALDGRIADLDTAFSEAETLMTEIRDWIPNIPHESVPVGEDEANNAIVREWGEERTHDFEAKPHYEVGPGLGILDTERGAKVTGSGWYFLCGDGARLERALIGWFLDVHRKTGYMELMPPFFVSEETLYGSGQLPKFADQMYLANEDKLYAIPTAEVPVTAFHRDEMLKEEDLPRHFCAYSACFRREAGAAGKDTRGVLRVHQFNKVELLKYTSPETSWDELESLTADAENLLKQLGLKYRVATLCTGDLGFASAKTYDLEVWAPVSKKWLEVSSCSNFTDYQARRSNLRYKPAEGGKPRFVHTLNGSGLALPRIQVAIWENYQQADGSLEIPEVVRKYMDGQEKIEKK